MKRRKRIIVGVALVAWVTFVCGFNMLIDLPQKESK